MPDFEVPQMPEPLPPSPRARRFGRDGDDPTAGSGGFRSLRNWGRGPWLIVGLVLLAVFAWTVYSNFRIVVPDKHIAVLIRKTGQDLGNQEEIAPSPDHKGIQKEVLTEGRYFYNPYSWDWEIREMQEVPPGQLGVLIRRHGADLPIGQFIAWNEDQKGIVPSVLRPGRYPLNPYLYDVELHKPVTIPAGYKGVVTNLSGEMPAVANQLLIREEDGDTPIVERDQNEHHDLAITPSAQRGVQERTLDPGTYYVNPYQVRINTIDCRSQRFNLAENNDMGFPSKDGFWVSLQGIIEFRIRPDKAAEVFVIYNDVSNDSPGQERVDEEIIRKIILPNARSFCRLQGSNSTGRDFIDGATRLAFQQEFQQAMEKACEPLGIEIIQALITKIDPPQAIAGPVRDREITTQKLKQYTEEIKQQESEVRLAVEQEKVKQGQAKIAAEQDVVKVTVEAKRKQEVAVTKANENLAVAKLKLDAARDEAAAIMARAKAEADVVIFQNEAEAAGWRRAVEALGDGESYARYVLFKKLAPGYRSIMTNTADSPLMEIFRTFLPENQRSQPAGTPTKEVKHEDQTMNAAGSNTAGEQTP